MSMTKFAALPGTNTLQGPINTAPETGVKHLTIKNLGPETAWLGTALNGTFEDPDAYPLGAGETLVIPVAPGDFYRYSTYAPGATLLVWEG